MTDIPVDLGLFIMGAIITVVAIIAAIASNYYISASINQLVEYFGELIPQKDTEDMIKELKEEIKELHDKEVK